MGPGWTPTKASQQARLSGRLKGIDSISLVVCVCCVCVLCVCVCVCVVCVRELAMRLYC